MVTNPEKTGPETLRARLRRQLLAARAALPRGEHARLSEAICTHLLHWFTARTPASVGFCTPFRGECDILPLARELHRRGWRMTMPVADKPTTAMEFRHWEPDCPLQTDRHGIPVPATPPCPAPEILLLPLVGIDHAGYRLGYGGGYFDRTLAALDAAGQRARCIGVGFELARVDTIEPAPYEQALDWLVTESGMRPLSQSLDGKAPSRDDAG
jgi:5-formyltetrahydrofolate cyclo-ligase